VRLRRLLCAVALLALAGCGGASSPGGTASIWVTRDRGATVLHAERVPAGLTVLQALDRIADVETRYGGRFVQAVDGIGGSLAARRDWFYFVNGVEPDVGAAEVRLHAGDVAWWDYRSWRGDMEQPVVVGAFPRPLTVGFGGRRRPIVVEGPQTLAGAAGALRSFLGPGGGTGAPNRFVLRVVAGADGAVLRARRGAANDAPVTFVLSGARDAVDAAARALARDPSLVRRRYTARFDAQGRVVG
jgi:hypothetical protein